MEASGISYSEDTREITRSDEVDRLLEGAIDIAMIIAVIALYNGAAVVAWCPCTDNATGHLYPKVVPR